MPILGTIASSIRANVDLGAMFPLQVVTIGAAGATGVTFSNIPNTYTHLQIRAMARSNASYYGRVRFNGDSGSNYNRLFFYGTGASVVSSFFSDYAYWGDIDPAANTFSMSVLDILDYANTNKFKTTRLLNGYDNNSSGLCEFTGSIWRSTAAITSITLDDFFTASLVQNSQIALYGVKSA